MDCPGAGNSVGADRPLILFLDFKKLGVGGGGEGGRLFWRIS